MFFNKYKRLWNEEMEKLSPECRKLAEAGNYYEAWKESQKEGRGTMADQQPWLSYAAIDHLDRFTKKDMRVFEYGGGGSTLYFTKRVAEVVTVEHHPEWFAKLADDFAARGIQNWTGRLIPGEDGVPQNASIGDPDAYVSDDEDNKGKNFKAYASAIDRFADEYFDIVLVDGRSRPSCTKHAIPKVKRGGWLVIDNSDRTYYLDAFRKILSEDFEPVLLCMGPTPYCTWFTQTGIWKKR